MSDKNGPWKPNPGNQGWGFPLGLVLWLGLLVAVGIGVWLLNGLFPGQLSSRDDSDLEIVRLVGLLALVSSGLLFTRQIKLGEVVRDLSIWIGLAAIILVGYSFRAELEAVYDRVSGELVPSQKNY